MIARIWHGKTTLENYEKYANFLTQKALPDYKKTDGLKNFFFLKQVKDNEGHFTLITFWENTEEIIEFAGLNFEFAKYYTEDDFFLLEKETKVQHHEVFAKL